MTDLARGICQQHVSGGHLRDNRVPQSELGRESAGLAGIEVQTEVLNLGLQNPLAVGYAQYVEPARASQAPVTGHEPGGHQQTVVDHRSLEIIDARMAHRHPTAKGKTVLERYSQCGRMP